MKGRAFLVISLFAVGASSHAITMQFVGTNKGQTVKMSGSVQPGSWFAGSLKYKIDGVDTITLCGDLTTQQTGNGPWNVTKALTSTQGPKFTKAGQMVTQFYGDALTNNTKAAALQLAIWEILHETSGTFDLTSGAVKLDSTTSNYASLIANANSYETAASPAGDAWRYISTDGGFQGQMSPVPEPASLAALGVGAIALLRRRKKK
ncbi:MAG: PEP-CTERM sorting domain-containing protein [Fimbriimonadaceae bacterium]|nr:PEP-CTERM sorting domain-containing protein [Fimbriimonadaceae bacterium]